MKVTLRKERTPLSTLIVFLLTETVISAEFTLGDRKQNFRLFWLHCHLIQKSQYTLALSSIEKIVIYELKHYVMVC